MLQWFLLSSLLTAVVLLLRFLLKNKISVRLRYALWGLVLIRLLVPGTVGTASFSMLNLLPASEISSQAGFSENSGDPFLHRSEAGPESNDQNSLPGKTAFSQTAPITSGKSPDQVLIKDSTGHKIKSTISTTAGQIISWIAFPLGTSPAGYTAALIYLCGALVIAGILLFTNLSFYRKLKITRQSAAKNVHTLLPADAGYRKTASGKRTLPIYLSTAVSSPCLYGVFRPSVYLPPHLLTEGLPLEYVITHELTHFQHLDHIWALLRGIALVLHWFNPLVWLAASLSKKDAELACDKATVTALGEEHLSEYGYTLIRLVTETPAASDFFRFTTAMKLRKSELAGRIKTLTGNPHTMGWAALALILILTCTAGCAFAGPDITAGSGSSTATADSFHPNGTSSSGQPDGSALSGLSDTSETEQNIPQGSSSALSYFPEFDELQQLQLLLYLETTRNDYEKRNGIKTTDFRITGTEELTTGTVSEVNGIYLTKIYCQFKMDTEDSDLTVNDPWITPDDDDTPILACFRDMRVPGQIIIGWHFTHEIEENYGGSYAEAAMDWYDASGLKDQNPFTLMLRTLFSANDDLTIRMLVEGDMLFPDYALSQSWFTGNNSDFFNYTFKPLTTTGIQESLWSQSPYYITLTASGTTVEYTFFGDSSIMCCSQGNTHTYYEYAPYDSDEDKPNLAEFLRERYFSLEMSYENIAFSAEGSFEDVASQFLELRKEQLFQLSPYNPSDITDWAIYSAPEILQKEDGNDKLFLFRCEYAVQVEDYASSVWWSGSAYPGEGKWENWIIHYCEARMELGADGLWRCTDLGTGGITLN